MPTRSKTQQNTPKAIYQSTKHLKYQAMQKTQNTTYKTIYQVKNQKTNRKQINQQ